MTKHIDSSEAMIERRAKLFQAGDYPDKGVTITPNHLDGLVRNFAAPVPVLIEHADSPLRMGRLTAVERVGDELFGTLALTPEADALVERSGARSLSIGLAPDLSEIREVSLVRHPRVSDARLFFVGDAQARREAAQVVQRFVKAGRLVPAQVPYAEAILANEATLEFAGDRTTLRNLLIAMIERQPPHALFTDLAPAAAEAASAHLMLPEEAAFYRRHFPEVSLDEIARRR